MRGRRMLVAGVAALAALGCTQLPADPRFSLAADDRQRFTLQGDPATCVPSRYAVFAKSGLVDLTIAGNGQRIDGNVFTNCLFKLVGADNVVAGTAETAQGYFIHGDRLQAELAPKTAEKGLPFGVDAAGIAPTFVFDGGVDLNARPELWETPTKLKPGVYVASGPITLAGNGITGQVTLIGSQVRLHGRRMALTPFHEGLLAYATDTGLAFALSGEDNALTGLVWGAAGKVDVAGARNRITGMVVADVFEMGGEKNRITWQDPDRCATTAPPAAASRCGTLLGLVSTFAGSLERRVPSCAPLTDGTRLDTAFRGPQDLAWDHAGNILVADHYNGAIRKITPGGRVTTLTGTRNVISGQPLIGPASELRVGLVSYLAVDAAGNIYFTRDGSYEVSRLEIATGMIAPFVGVPSNGRGEPFLVDAVGTDARFRSPRGLAIRGNTMYVADGFNHAIRQVDLTTRAVTTLAGGRESCRTVNERESCGMLGDFLDGVGREANFFQPSDLGIAPDGHLIVGDTGNHMIREVSLTGVVTTLVGDTAVSDCPQDYTDEWGNFYPATGRCKPAAGYTDGTGQAVRMTLPYGIDVDACGNVYWMERGLGADGGRGVRKCTPAGVVTTVAGGGPAGRANGLGAAASFSGLGHVLVDPQGGLYVADESNNCIRRIQ